MLLLLGLVVAAVALAAMSWLGLGLSGVFGGSGGSERKARPRPGRAAAGLAGPVAAAVGLLVLAVLALGIEGGGEGPAAPGPAPSTSAAPAASRLTGATTTIPGVFMPRAERDRFSLYLPTGGLRPGGVVRVRATGFGWHERGRIEHCVTERGRLPACTDPFPVQFDGDGQADFQLALSGDFAPGGCRAGQPVCGLRLTGDDGDQYASQQFVLIDELVPGQVSVAPSRRLIEGETVEVAVAGFPPGARATAVLCAPPGDPQRCAATAGGATLVIDAEGGGRTTLTVSPDAAGCSARRPCGVVVLVGDGYITAAPVAFSIGRGVDYDAGRLWPGAAAALVLLGIAVLIAVKTDWTKPSEAATPALDAADLRTDQSLDGLFGADEELDRLDPIPW